LRSLNRPSLSLKATTILMHALHTPSAFKANGTLQGSGEFFMNDDDSSRNVFFSILKRDN
jgi:hypothetical protein